MTPHAPAASSRTDDLPIAASASVERRRLEANGTARRRWRRFGPYLSERQWGTVREDYSADGTAWDSFPHDAARSRAYRWGEDGLAGLSDDRQLLCLGLALWNGKDPILKERLFGLTGPEGNHGEDVKEVYYYLDAVPSHAYLEMLYKYPQEAFPYAALVEAGRSRGRTDPEFELVDTGIFDDERYFDVFVEYAKADPDDILMRVRACNRGARPAFIALVPQVWFRNTWSWGRDACRPWLRAEGVARIDLHHDRLGRFVLHADAPDEILVCDNETNHWRLHGADFRSGFFKDGINDFLVRGDRHAINPERRGTKAGLVWRRLVPAGGTAEIRVRLARPGLADPFGAFDATLDARRRDTDAFYDELHPAHLSTEERRVQRQALAGMIWSQQFYHLDVRDWLDGDPAQPPPPAPRRQGRNHEWRHLNNADVISMPDTWEYPWYAAWDLAFHALPLALVDTTLAKEQLLLLTREWYMHPNGQLPAYEWAFGDVNPPVHAWAAWRVFEWERRRTGGAGDIEFLERILHKLLLNFTWWVNRKDAHGRNLFQGGFLGLDNIGVFDRSAPLPVAAHIEQADGTAWMAMYSLNLLRIALELARHRRVYEDIATKFFEHFLYIAGAMSNVGGEGLDLWDDTDGFYYDVLHCDTADGSLCESVPMRVRSMVGLVPLFAVEALSSDLLDQVPRFRARMRWFLEHRPDLAALVSRWEQPGAGDQHLLSLLRGHRMKRILERVLDENEFLSPYGIRALSRVHRDRPYRLEVGGAVHTVAYEPGESESGLFGGNSNWRGPVWMPVNYLLVESLRKFHVHYGDGFTVEYPTGSGTLRTLSEVADDLSLRLRRLFLPGEDGARPCLGDHPRFRQDPRFRDHLLFHEYFHGDDGRGIGASHQTGWTGLVAMLLSESRV
ncbi:MAG: glucosidase [Vicinamibacterales bacterium]